MISYKLAGNQTTLILSVILALILLRLLRYFSAAFDKTCIILHFSGCTGKTENSFEMDCLGLIRK